MASVGITVSIHKVCNSHSYVKKQSSKTRTALSSVAKETARLNVKVEDQNHLRLAGNPEKTPLLTGKSKEAIDETQRQGDEESSSAKFFDNRWKNGTWDLNMFVKNGKIDWNSVITAEARRRKFLELYPEAATNDDPVDFRSSIIPWWAWITHSHLPEAELLNGRAAMVGFFTAYIVDGLTGLDVVGQTGNFICKVALFMTVVCIILFRRTQDFENLKKLADEATFYDKQWQSSWQDQSPSGDTSDSAQSSKNI